MDAPQSYPTILMRTPYFRVPMDLIAQRFAERGYHVLVQDVRGRFGSDGDFEIFIDEVRDSLDVMQWLGTLDWFDGRLGMWGMSYLGYVQWAVLSAIQRKQRQSTLILNNSALDLRKSFRPTETRYIRALMDELDGRKNANYPRLMALFPITIATDIHYSVFRGGALNLDVLARYVAFTDHVTLLRGALARGAYISALKHVFDLTRVEATCDREMGRYTLTHPVQDVFARLGAYPRAIRTEGDSSYWTQRKLTRCLADPPPTHMLCGWYDFLLEGQLKDWRDMEVRVCVSECVISSSS